MDGCAHTTYISCISDISCTCLRKFSDGSVFSWTRSRKAFHPSLSLGPPSLRGICYTVIFHRPWNPPSRTLEALFHDLWVVTWPETTFMASPLTRKIIPLKTVSCKKPEEWTFWPWRDQLVHPSCQWGTSTKEGAPTGALSQCITQARLNKECFLKINGGSLIPTNSWTSL